MRTTKILLSFLLVLFVACKNGEGDGFLSSQETETTDVEIKSEGVKLPENCEWKKVEPYDPISHITISTNYKTLEFSKYNIPSHVKLDGYWFYLKISIPTEVHDYRGNYSALFGGDCYLFTANGNNLYHFSSLRYYPRGDDKMHECGKLELKKNGNIVIKDFPDERVNGVYQLNRQY